MRTTSINVRELAADVLSGELCDVSSSMFGAIAVNFTAAGCIGFWGATDYLEIKHVRWPGGTLAERGVVDENGDFRVDGSSGEPAFSLRYNELLNPRALEIQRSGNLQIESFSDALRGAATSGASFSLILPTKRYVDQPTDAKRDVTSFLERLYNGDDFPRSDIPERMMFDIGNEHYNPTEYARVAVEMLLAVREFRDANPSVEFSVSIQAMKSGQESLQFIIAFQRYAAELDESDLLAEADTVRAHALDQDLNQSLALESSVPRIWAIRHLVDAIAEVRTEAGIDISRNDVDLYFSAWTVDSEGDEKGAAAMVSLFVSMLEMGADAAASWGIATPDEVSSALSVVTNWASGDTRYTMQGEAYRMMAETLPGTTLLSTETMDGSPQITYNTFAFVDDSKLVIFLAANELRGLDRTATVDLRGFGPIGYAWAESVRSSSSPDSSPVVSRSDLDIDGRTISVDFQSDYEVIRIIVSRVSPGDAPLYLVGSDDGDVLRGGGGADRLLSSRGHDFLSGGRGADFIHGGGGFDVASWRNEHTRLTVRLGEGVASSWGTVDRLVSIEAVEGGSGHNFLIGDEVSNRLTGGIVSDRLIGMGGADTLSAGQGNDTLSGGTGSDVLRGGVGSDILFGGEGADILLGGPGNDLLWGGGGSDRFVFCGSIGRSTIMDFNLEENDVINISAVADRFDIRSERDLHSIAEARGSSTILEFSSTDSLRLVDVSLEEFLRYDIIF